MLRKVHVVARYYLKKAWRKLYPINYCFMFRGRVYSFYGIDDWDSMNSWLRKKGLRMEDSRLSGDAFLADKDWKMGKYGNDYAAEYSAWREETLQEINKGGYWGW